MLTLNVYSTISKYVAKQKVMITLNDPDADNVKHCLSTAINFCILTDRPFLFQLIFPYVCFYLEKQLSIPYSYVKHVPGDCSEANCNYSS